MIDVYKLVLSLSWSCNFCLLLHFSFQEKDLRIAWQYKKYFGDPQSNISSNNGKFVHNFPSFFDLVLL